MSQIKNYVFTLANALVGRNSANSENGQKLANISKQDQRIIERIVQSFVSRSKQDIGTWRAALTIAENIENPQRFRLYTLYKDVELDDQVITSRLNLKASVKAEGFYLGDAKTGEANEDATALVKRPWFYDFMDYCIDSVAQGFVLLELEGMIRTELGLEVMGFEEVPREHVVPERNMVVFKIGEDKGVDFTEPAFARSVISIGKKKNFGLLNPVAPKALIKKNVEAAWAEFCEMFGMPIRIGKVASRNKADLDRMEAFLKAMGQAAYAVTGSEDTIELKETSRGDAYQVYDKLMERQDKAISKIFLGQTMTTDNGSSKSQAEVHERIGDKRMFELKLFIEFTINFKLIPLLIANGYNLKGLKFCWETATEITDTDIKMDEFLVTYFEFEDLEYFKHKYRVPIKAIKEKINTASPAQEPAKSKTKSNLNHIEKLHHSISELYNHAH